MYRNNMIIIINDQLFNYDKLRQDTGFSYGSMACEVPKYSFMS